MSESQSDAPGKAGDLVRRHRLSTRLWHWTNALAVLVMLMSGLMIFNAHPRLYWGEAGANHDPAWLQIGSTRSGEGVLALGDMRLRTTGVLGISGGEERAFPRFATLPSYYSLASARLWHMAFAWLLAAAWIAILPRALSALVRPRPDYNAGQRFAYPLVQLVLLPAMIWTGLAMAPGMDAAWPFLTEWLGGRQTARSIHFIVAFALLAFTLGHIALWLRSDPLGRLKAMTLGGGRP